MPGASGTPIWQRNDYDHIIRHKRALHAIRHDIQDNPRRRHLDRENVRRTGSDPLRAKSGRCSRKTITLHLSTATSVMSLW
ncbi:hypothetical protein [Roseiflexus castenholzii]|uniref:hypothetical protein n=1 Tax=Roseiflexus castenholzii TaxID=120962 RepID=UPI0002F8626D|nr:hypothetical protein [Roseiflexus castenholzii]